MWGGSPGPQIGVKMRPLAKTTRVLGDPVARPTFGASSQNKTLGESGPHFDGIFNRSALDGQADSDDGVTDASLVRKSPETLMRSDGAHGAHTAFFGLSA